MLIHNAITHATFPPVYLEQLSPYADYSFESVIVAGESCSEELVRLWTSKSNFFNAYGPTEATVCASVSMLALGDPISIGSSIDNTELYILDKNNRLLPYGGVGELAIGGAGLARGYLNLPELTAERFIKNPFSDESNARLYKTGDLVRYISDGNIQFIGRKDDQVKIRGFRVELGEIENCLNKHPSVKASKVLCVDNACKKKTDLELEKKTVELWPSIAEFLIYDDLVYGIMASDEFRNECYRKVFNKNLKGKVVVEIGPGTEVVLSRLCIEAGAKKVYAIEILKETYLKAKALVKSLDLEHKIILIHGDCLKTDLPEKADYCISEIVGSIGGSEGAAKIINDSKRFLKKPECILPRRTVTKIAAFNLSEECFDYVFSDSAAHYVNRIFEEHQFCFDLRLSLKNIDDNMIVSTSDILEDLNHTEIVDLESKHKIRLDFKQSSTFTGFLVWLNLHIDEDNVVDILKHKASWLPIYFPISLNGIKVSKGDRLEAIVHRKLSKDGLHPDFFITGNLYQRQGVIIPISYDAYHVTTGFRDTPFYERLFSESKVPRLDDSKILTNNNEIDKRLTAYVIANKEEDTGLLSQLKLHLENYLPNYMQPSSFVFLEEFPLTPNRKIDKKALRTKDSSLPQKEYVSPESKNEIALVRIWSNLLNLDVSSIGVTSNFFDLGGHSLLVIKLITLIKSEFLVEPNAKTIFEIETLGELVASIENALVIKNLKSRPKELDLEEEWL
jgi:acyl-CoA synthetase (AMP-forming)/AMP-acid ligase II/acyl carrier protein